MDKIKLSDVIDINYLQTLQDSFSDATGMASISIDLDGNVTHPSNFHDFCMKYTRNCSEGLKRCLECDKRGGEESEATGKPSVYLCHAGLIDFSAGREGEQGKKKGKEQAEQTFHNEDLL